MPNGPIEIDDAVKIVLDCARPLASEPVELTAALGRVLAEDVSAAEPVPPFDSSAMDGFAVRARDVRGACEGSPVTLRVADESRAGHPAGRALGAGEAIAVSTGATMPSGADAVIRIEQTLFGNGQGRGQVRILEAAPAGRDVRRAGDDVVAGQTVLRRGTRLGAAELGVLASAGCVAPRCVRRPRVSIVTTGDELAGPGAHLGPGMLRDSSALTIPALARMAGAEVAAVTTVGDDAEATEQAIAAALGCDAIVVCGGVSVGAHDHVKGSLRALGARERFWGIALKPGKPTWFGMLEQSLVFGLPGNPVSAMVTFVLLAWPALQALSGAPAREPRSTATLTRDYEKQPGRAHAVRCRLTLAADGWRAEPMDKQGSHVLTSMLGADALAIVPSASGPVRAGERVEIAVLPRGCAGASLGRAEAPVGRAGAPLGRAGAPLP